MTPKPPNILVSGAGIASAAFTSCLLRAYPSATIIIIDRDPVLRLTGASVDIRSSAVDIIKWMNVESTIRENVTHEEGLQMVTGEGKEIGTLRASGNSEMQSFTSEYEIFRGELAKIFMDTFQGKVELILDEMVESYESEDDGVMVKFKRSGESRKFDLLVAADGLGSKIRGMMLNANPQDQFHDEGTHIAYFTVDKDFLEGSKLAKGFCAPGGRVVFMRPDPHPSGRTRCNLVKITPKSDVATREKLDAALKSGSESYMDLMDEMFAGLPWLTAEVLKSMRTTDDFYSHRFGQIRSPILQRDRVVLLGDAGYATPGIGTSLAIIGGYILAGELLSHPDDVPLALRQYEAIMHPFVKSQQYNFNGMAWSAPQTQWGLHVRDAILKTFLWFRLDRLAIMIGSALGFTEKKLAMPDYKWPVEESVS